MLNLPFHVDRFEQALLALDRAEAGRIIDSALGFYPVIEVASELVTYSLERIGEMWEQGKLSLSQVYMSGVICEEIMEKILPASSEDRKVQTRMAIGVFEDFHLLGKRVVLSALRAGGYQVEDLGGGLKKEDLVQMVVDRNIRILLLSVLMLPSALHIRSLKEALSGYDVKIVVGGAPFRLDPLLWKEVGADAFGKDSGEALTIVKNLTRHAK